MKLKLPALPVLAARERLFATLGVAMVVLTLADRTVIGPWWRHTRGVRQEIGELRRDVATHRKLLSRQADVAAKMAAYANYLRIARDPEVEMGDLTRELQALGDQSGVKLSVTPQQTTQNWPYQEHAMDVQYTGTLEQAVRFIYLIESSKKVFEVQRASLAMDKRGGEQLQGSMRLSSVAILGTSQPPAAEPTISKKR